jgi:hypothetical protein
MSHFRAALLGVAFAGLAGALAAQPKAERHTSADGMYAVAFPGRPKLATQTAKSALGDLQVHVATYATADGNVYLVSYTDFPAAATRADNRKTLFDGVRDGFKGRGAVAGEKDFQFGPDKLPGREGIVDKDKGKQRVKFRAVLRDNRLYQVAVIGTEGFVSGTDATAFLDSLELTK